MKLTELLIGRKLKIMTDAKVEVELEVKSSKFHYHSRDLEPSTPQNDWWPQSESWTTIDVEFVNGYKKSYNNIEDINIVE